MVGKRRQAIKKGIALHASTPSTRSRPLMTPERLRNNTLHDTLRNVNKT